MGAGKCLVEVLAGRLHVVALRRPGSEDGLRGHAVLRLALELLVGARLELRDRSERPDLHLHLDLLLLRHSPRSLADRGRSSDLGHQISRSRRASSASIPSISTSLSREEAPRTTATLPGASPNRLARSLQTAAFALPSTGGGGARPTILPPPSPAISSPRGRPRDPPPRPLPR